jgi:uncharacterized membrane protein YhaH (DUF805 family)
MFLPLRRYFDIFGRSQRREFWLFFLMLWAVDAVIVTIFGSPVSYTNGMNFYWGTQTSLLGQGLIGLIALFTMIPSYTLSVRRLHDIDRSGWWLLVWFVPFIGWLILFIFFCLDGTYGRNRYGNDPRGRGAADIFR